MNRVLLALRFPVLALLGGLEDWIFTDGGVSVGIDLLNIFGANAVREIGRELLLEATMKSVNDEMK